jgi:hypothetical protein
VRCGGCFLLHFFAGRIFTRQERLIMHPEKIIQKSFEKREPNPRLACLISVEGVIPGAGRTYSGGAERSGGGVRRAG